MWRLTSAAIDDLDAASAWGARTFGFSRSQHYEEQMVEMFDTLSHHPQMAPERRAARSVVRLMPHRAHNILYVIQDGDVVILRVLHHLQDWFELL